MGNRTSTPEKYHEAVQQGGRISSEKDYYRAHASERHPLLLLYDYHLNQRKGNELEHAYFPDVEIRSRKVLFEDICFPSPQYSEYHPIKLDFEEGFKREIPVFDGTVPERENARKVIFSDMIDPVPSYQEVHPFKLDFGSSLPHKNKVHLNAGPVPVRIHARKVIFWDMIDPSPRYQEVHPFRLDFDCSLYNKNRIAPSTSPVLMKKNSRKVFFWDMVDPPPRYQEIHPLKYGFDCPLQCKRKLQFSSSPVPARKSQRDIIFCDITNPPPQLKEIHPFKLDFGFAVPRSHISYITIHSTSMKTVKRNSRKVNFVKCNGEIQSAIPACELKIQSKQQSIELLHPFRKTVHFSILKNATEKRCNFIVLRGILKKETRSHIAVNMVSAEEITHLSVQYAAHVFWYLNQPTSENESEISFLFDIKKIRSNTKERSPLYYVKSKNEFQCLQKMKNNISLNFSTLFMIPEREESESPVLIDLGFQGCNVCQEHGTNFKQSMVLDIETHHLIKESNFQHLLQKLLKKNQEQFVKLTLPEKCLERGILQDYIQHCFQLHDKSYFSIPTFELGETYVEKNKFTKCFIKFFSKKAANKFVSVMQPLKRVGKCDVKLVSEAISPDDAKEKKSSLIWQLWDLAQPSMRQHESKISEVENKKQKNSVNSKKEVTIETNILAEKEVELEKQKQEFHLFISVLIRTIENLPVTHNFQSKLEMMEKRFKIEIDAFKNALPIYARKSEIIEMVAKNQVSILIGETGSGKSTQLVKYLYEAGLSRNGVIACTQPRKVAATSLAKRVASEMCCELGSLVGFKVGMKKELSKSTMILFVTDHTLLKECITDENFSRYACVIIDEVHERSLNTDLLLGMLRRVCKTRPELRIIITSATINPDIFVEYFPGSPILKVSGRAFPVELIYSNETLNPDSDYVSKTALKAVEIACNEEKGDILAFLPTPLETEKCREIFEKFWPHQMTNILCYSLHGKTQGQDQHMIFSETAKGKRKIVFATNSAETSVTIPGIRYVIDSGLMKEKFYDPSRNMNLLKVVKLSKSSADQRKGRAGRTSAGKCYRLYTKEDFESMNNASKPEIMRVNLGMAVLQLLSYNISDVMSFEFVEMPQKSALQDAVDDLVSIGAVQNNKLTKLGKDLSLLSLEPRMAKLVLDGFEKGIGFETILVASFCVIDGNIYFRGDNKKKEKADKLKVRFCKKGGDMETMLEVYKEWFECEESKKNKWCFENSINAKSMRMLRQTVQEIILTLKNEMKFQINQKFSTSPDMMENVLTEILWRNFNVNACIFSGHKDLGYIQLQRPNKTLLLHPSCSLKPLAFTPKFLVYQNTLITSRNYMLNVTCIPEEVVAKSLSSEIDDINQHLVSPIVIKSLGCCLAQTLIGKKHETRLSLQRELQKFLYTENLIVEVSYEMGSITVFCHEKYHGFVKDIVVNLVRTEQARLYWRTIEMPLYEEGLVRISIQNGGEVKCILLTNEYTSIFFPNMPSDTDENNIIETMKESFSVLHHDINVNKRGNKFLKMTFFSPNVAKEALDFVKNHFPGINAKPDYKDGNKSLPVVTNDTELRLSWCRRATKRFGFIKFHTDYDAERVKNEMGHLAIKRSIFPLKTSKKNSNELHVSCLPEDCLNEIKHEIGETILDETGIEPESIVIVRERVDDVSNSLLKQLQTILKVHLQNVDIDQSKYKITVKKPNEHSVDHVAFVVLHNHNDVDEIANALRSKLILGRQIHVKKNLKTRLFVREEIKSFVLNDLRKAIDCLLENDKAYVQWNPKQKGDLCISVVASSYRDLAEARSILTKPVLGEKVEMIKQDIDYFKMKNGSSYVQILEKRYDVLIKINLYLMCAIIYGKSPMVRKASALLKMKINELSLLNMKIYDIAKMFPPGMTKYLMQQYGLDLELIPRETQIDSINLKLMAHLITVRGSPDAIKRVDELLSMASEQLTGAQIVGNDTLDDCPVCLCDVDEPYKLESCGDAYCRDCINRLFSEAIKDKSFPIVCVKCNKNIVVKDIEQILGGTMDKLGMLVQASVDHYVQNNHQLLRYCTTPDCGMVYRISERAENFVCEKCFASICRKCHATYHIGLTCELYSEMKEMLGGRSFDEYSKEEWLKGDTKNRGICPKCRSGIEKNGGCMRVTCTKCKTNICWNCKEMFETHDETYNHLQQCFGAIFDENDL